MTSIKRKPLEKRPLYRDEIKNTIREAIVAGDLKPGDRIIETQWAKELGVSQSPVREAIRELEMIGLVENIPYQGCFVRKVTLKDMRDSYRVRTYLEMLGIQDAVEGADEDDLKEIHHVYKEMETAAKNNDFNLYIEKNELFHEKIMCISQNNLLIRLWKQSNIQDSTYFGTQFSDQSLEALSIRHKDLYEAIVERDLNRAKEVIYLHFEELIEELERQEK